MEPRNEEERSALPIPYVEAMCIVQSSAPAGLSAWYRLDWQSYYLAFMKIERSKPWSEKQIAFIGMLFGVAQGNLEKSMNKSGPCAERERTGVARLLSNATGE